MKIILEQAEAKLVATLERIKNGYDQTCCLHILGSAFMDKDFAKFPTLIPQWFGYNDDGLVLVCHDRDIFIFGPNINADVFTKFKEIFYKRFKPVDNDGSFSEISFYDIHSHGAILIELAQAKLEQKQRHDKAEEEKARQHDKERKREKILATPLNEDLIQTIAERRKDRVRPNILVVEDDPFSRKLIGASLNTHFAVLFAENGFSAITGHLKSAPSIVFLDIDLPDISGHDVLKKILEIDPAAYIVMLSGNSDVNNIMRAVNLGAKGFVGKPFAKEKLLQYIKKCAGHHLQTTGA